MRVGGVGGWAEAIPSLPRWGSRAPTFDRCQIDSALAWGAGGLVFKGLSVLLFRLGSFRHEVAGDEFRV